MAFNPAVFGMTNTMNPLPPSQTAPLSYQPMDYQVVRDMDHLRILAIFHYVQGALTIVFSSFGLVHLTLGILMVLKPGKFGGGLLALPPPPRGTSPAFMGAMLAILGGIVVLSGWTIGLLTIYSGRCIRARRKHVLSLIMAGVNCLTGFTGIALGVFTFIVLLRESVRNMYRTPAT